MSIGDATLTDGEGGGRVTNSDWPLVPLARACYQSTEPSALNLHNHQPFCGSGNGSEPNL